MKKSFSCYNLTIFLFTMLLHHSIAGVILIGYKAGERSEYNCRFHKCFGTVYGIVHSYLYLCGTGGWWIFGYVAVKSSLPALRLYAQAGLFSRNLFLCIVLSSGIVLIIFYSAVQQHTLCVIALWWLSVSLWRICITFV